MKKKIILALLLAAFIAGGAFAQMMEMSVGGGLLFDFSGNNGLKIETTNPPAPFGDGKSRSDYTGFRNTSFGAFAFFDVTYAEIDTYFAYGLMSIVGETKEGTASAKKSNPVDAGGALQFGFSMLGKYPVDLGGVTIFPLVGFDYNIVLSADSKLRGNGKAMDFSQFGFLAGVGTDIKMSGPLFLRLEGLLHMRFPPKIFKDTKTAVDLTSVLYEAFGGKFSAKTTWGFGPQIKAAVGFKIK
ncbi:MAG: hypothetical protein LBC76_08950 [Treponema sp.]|jgi:hypothetical protein|nr:hypothetical protein [Treponema sp.]